MVDMSRIGTRTYPNNLQDLWPSDYCGSSDQGKDSEEDTGEDTYVDKFSNDDDDDSDSEHDRNLTKDCTIQNTFMCQVIAGLFQQFQGWRSGESTRLPPTWPGFDSRTQCHM